MIRAFCAWPGCDRLRRTGKGKRYCVKHAEMREKAREEMIVRARLRDSARSKNVVINGQEMNPHRLALQLLNRRW